MFQGGSVMIICPIVVEVFLSETRNDNLMMVLEEKSGDQLSQGLILKEQ